MASKIAVDEIDIQLELKDRINYPHVLQTTLMNIKRAISSGELSIDRIEDMMWDFFTDIPHDWYDNQFSVETKKAFMQKEVDCRPVWGDVKLSPEICKQYGMAVKKTVTTINVYVLKNAIINLLHRRDMLVRKKKIEYSSGKNLKIKTLDDLAEYVGQDDNNDDDMITNTEDNKIAEELKKITKAEEKEDEEVE